MVHIEALLQLAASAGDTVIMRQVPGTRGLLDQITAISTVILTIALTAFAVVAVPAAWRFRAMYRRVDHLLERIYGDISPIMRHASTIADNIDFITTSIRTDVQKVNATIASANERVQEAVAMTEARLNEFNALLAVVQDEAEQAFVSTASTLRGVRSGAAIFHQDDGMDLASAEADAAELAEELAEHLERQEEGDGYDSSPESAAETIAATPRLRPRTRRQRRA
jgi:uncharacterized protein YoxC